jgi:hypothetical protein
MNAAQLQIVVQTVLAEFARHDVYLLQRNVGERAIAARIAMYLQQELSSWHVDVEYNRYARDPKQVSLPEEYADYRDKDGMSYVVPDIIVHRRGPDGPNLLVLELKKTSHREFRGLRDRARIEALKSQLHYAFGCLLVCETRPGREPAIDPTWV